MRQTIWFVLWLGVIVLAALGNAAAGHCPPGEGDIIEQLLCKYT